MADDQELASCVRTALAGVGDIREIRMFGGIGFMLDGNMVAALSSRGLLLRVGKDRQAEALALPSARPMMMRGRTMEGYVYVNPPARSKPLVENMLHMAIDFVQTLPPKPEQKSRKKKGEGK